MARLICDISGSIDEYKYIEDAVYRDFIQDTLRKEFSVKDVIICNDLSILITVEAESLDDYLYGLYRLDKEIFMNNIGSIIKEYIESA